MTSLSSHRLFTEGAGESARDGLSRGQRGQRPAAAERGAARAPGGRERGPQAPPGRLPPRAAGAGGIGVPASGEGT